MIDISVPVDGHLPSWPGSPRPTFEPLMQIARGDDANVTKMTFDLHTGTHVDAPLHFIEGGGDLESVGLRPFVGAAFVADAGDARAIGPVELESLDVPPNVTRLLLRSSNSRDRLLRQEAFVADAAALTAEGARWVVDRGLELIGIDYLSIQSINDGPETHQILLGAGVVILEGIDLETVARGHYDLMCLPIRLAGPEAAPARAVLLPEGTL